MTSEKEIINFDRIAEEFRKVMTHEDISKPDREKIIAAVVDHTSNNTDDLLLREDVVFKSNNDDDTTDDDNDTTLCVSDDDPDVKPPVGYLTTTPGYTPDGWTKLDTGNRHGYRAHFRGGYKCETQPVEVLIWSAPSEVFGIKDGDVVQADVHGCFDIDEDELDHIGEGYRFQCEPENHAAHQHRFMIEIIKHQATVNRLIRWETADEVEKAALEKVKELNKESGAIPVPRQHTI